MVVIPLNEKKQRTVKWRPSHSSRRKLLFLLVVRFLKLFVCLFVFFFIRPWFFVKTPWLRPGREEEEQGSEVAGFMNDGNGRGLANLQLIINRRKNFEVNHSYL